MTQLFKLNEENRKFFEIMKNAKAMTTSSDLVQMYNEVVGSRALGEVIFDNGFVDFGFEIGREFFVDNYLSIIEAMTKPITLPSYRILIKALLGEEVEVTFDIPKPGHLIVNVIEQMEDFGLKSLAGEGLMFTITTNNERGWAVRPDSGLMSRAGVGFAFRKKYEYGVLLASTLSPYTIEQARNVLENLNTGGVYTEYNFSVGVQ